VAGECTLDLSGEEIVNIAVVHEGSGFNPGAAIHVGTLCHVDTVLQEAHDALKDHAIENYPEYVEELQGEWGDEWESILTESYDGMAWTLPLRTAAQILCSHDRAAAFVTFDA